MKDDLLLEFLIIIDFKKKKKVFLIELEIYCHGKFQKLSLLYFWDKLSNQVNSCYSVEKYKIEFNEFRNNG